MAPTKRKPIGKALQWSEEDLDRLAAVTPEDIALAQAFYRANAPARYANLLDAQPAGEEQVTPPTEDNA